jgi:hypothetical protein
MRPRLALSSCTKTPPQDLQCRVAVQPWWSNARLRAADPPGHDDCFLHVVKPPASMLGVRRQPRQESGSALYSRRTHLLVSTG